MKRVVALALMATVSLGACGGPDVTHERLENAVGPAFAQLYDRQQSLLGHDGHTAAQAAASCRRSAHEPLSGAADDWVCTITLQLGGPTSSYVYEVNAKADGCYTADGSPAVVGGRTLTTGAGRTVVNPLFAFDGCFDTS